jgi:hypothetical protein
VLAIDVRESLEAQHFVPGISPGEFNLIQGLFRCVCHANAGFAPLCFDGRNTRVRIKLDTSGDSESTSHRLRQASAMKKQVIRTVHKTVKGGTMIRPALVTRVLAALSTRALAVVSVRNPWVHATASNQNSTVAFMQLASSIDARLVHAHSPLARLVEIQELVLDNYAMQMNAVPALDLPAGRAVELKPDGYMMMLTGLKRQIRGGDTVPMSLVIEGMNKKRGTIKLDLLAMTMDSAAAGEHSLA